MSRGFDPKIRAALIEQLILKYGPKCQLQGCPFASEMRVPGGSLVSPEREITTVNHVNGNHEDSSWGNLNLMHKACNRVYFADLNRRARLLVIMGVVGPVAPAGSSAPLSETGERKGGEATHNPIPAELRNKSARELEAMLPKYRIVPKASDSYSNRKSAEARPAYYLAAFARMVQAAIPDREGKCSWPTPDALNEELALRVGCVPQTTARYLAMLSAEGGAFEKMSHPQTQTEILVWRDQTYAYLNPEELLELFPVAGLVYVDETRAVKLLDLAAERMNADPRRALKIAREAVA